MSNQRYTLPAILIHWVHAVLILTLLWLGWTMIDLPKGAERSAAYGLHKSLGLLALLLVIVRLGWRSKHAPPPAMGAPWEIRLASATHHALYLCLVVAPLAGFLASNFTTYPVKFFGFALPKLGEADEALNAIFKSIHIVSVWSAAGLIALHVTAAAKHAAMRDGTLRRMLPGRPAR